MVLQSEEIEEILHFEPLINELLDFSFTDQHIRVLAMMFKLGGYTTLNVLTEKIGLAQPTVSNRVSELEEVGYIRKNSELKPKVLVLTLDINDLKKRLEHIIQTQHNAAAFLKELSAVEDKTPVKATVLKAMSVLHPDNELMAKLLSFVYLHKTITRRNLIQLSTSSKKEYMKLDREIDIILSTHSNLFNTICFKHQKSEIYVQPFLPLNIYVQARLVMLDSIHEHYRRLLLNINQLYSDDYSSIIPHQVLPTIPDIKQRINTCLKYYETIKIIDNSIYQEKMANGEILESIVSSEYFSEKHDLKVLTPKIKDYKTITSMKISSKIDQREIKGDLTRDYQSRDFIVFERHGCVVIPSQEDIPSYYNISPQFIKSVLAIFEPNWRISNAI